MLLFFCLYVCFVLCCCCFNDSSVLEFCLFVCFNCWFYLFAPLSIQLLCFRNPTFVQMDPRSSLDACLFVLLSSMFLLPAAKTLPWDITRRFLDKWFLTLDTTRKPLNYFFLNIGHHSQAFKSLILSCCHWAQTTFSGFYHLLQIGEHWR